MFAIKNNKLIYNFLSMGFVQGGIVLLQLLVIPFTIKKIGIDGFGVVAVAQVVMLYLSGFADYGFNQTATRDVSLFRADRIVLSRIFFKVLFTKLVLCFFAFIVLLILLLCIPVFRAHGILYLAAFVFVIGQSSLVTWFFQGLERMQFIAILTLSGRLIFVALVFLFLKNKEQDFLFLFFLGTGTLIAGTISIFSACRLLKLKFIRPSRSDIAKELREGWHFTIANLSGYTSQYANIFILRIFTNDLVTGYYGIAERIFFAMRQILVIFSQVIYPRVCQLVQSGRSQLVLFFKKIYFPFLLLVISGCSLGFIFSLQILHFFIGYPHETSSFLLRVMCVITVIICMNIPACLVLLASNAKKKYLKIAAIGTLLNIIANIVLVRFFEAKGIVMSVLLTEFFITVGLHWEVYRLYVHDNTDCRSYLKSVFYESK
ncbi:MAG: oligosaccharide flippase family protein [Chitinophagaceae bacterium]